MGSAEPRRTFCLCGPRKPTEHDENDENEGLQMEDLQAHLTGLRERINHILVRL